MACAACPFVNQWDYIETVQRVQEEYRLFTMAVTPDDPIASSTWHEDHAILEECTLESLTTRFTESIIVMVRANKFWISDEINGTVDVEEELRRTIGVEEGVANDQDLGNLRLSPDQQRVNDRLREYISCVLEVQVAATEVASR